MLPGALDRYPFNSPWLRGIVSRHWLKTWFIANSAVAVVYSVANSTLLFFDARLYLMATQAWLGGGDPWDVQLAGNYFAAPPPTLLALAPIAMLPIEVGVAILAFLVIAGAIATVRLLCLPWWWILFPPLVGCMLSANVQGLLIPLILLRAGAVATLLKIYAGVPLFILGRWRALLIAGLLIALTAPFLPWATYLSEFALIASRLAEQTKHHIPIGILIAISPAVLIALSIVGRERAAWLAPLALWPSQQYYYGTFVMPIRSQLAAAVIALPITGSGILALGVLATLDWRRGARPRWSFARGTRPRLGPSAR